MSDKGFERSDKMSVDYISHAKGMSEYILTKSYRGPGDTVDAAMHRAERRFGVPATWMHRLRCRNIKDMPVSAYAAISGDQLSDAQLREAKHEGRQAVAVETAQAITKAIQNRAGINETIDNMDSIALCLELGGVHSECEQLRGLAAD